MKNLFIALLFTSCSSTKNYNNHIYWINSTKVHCVGVSPMQCFQIQKSKTLNLSGEWEFLYSQIIGFEYELGFIYKLKVKEEQLENVPPDASSIKYTLIKVLEKKKDKR